MTHLELGPPIGRHASALVRAQSDLSQQLFPYREFFSGLEPIADVLKDILVLAIVAGGDNRCEPGDLRGYYE